MRPKRLIVCADGTWNADPPIRGNLPSNAARLARAVLPSDEADVDQIVFYVDGIGTSGPIRYYTRGYTGWGLTHKVSQCYRFLTENYQDGDEIFLFGMSRGAFVVRSLSGLISYCGLLNPEAMGRLQEAYEVFRDSDGKTETEAASDVRQEARYPVPIRMIGAWDTVDALGLPIPGLRRLTRPPVGFHDNELAANVEAAYHALAFDETRSAFHPSIWTLPEDDARTVEQVWFPGAHPDVCGGFGNKGLADISFGWMIEKAMGCRLALNRDYLEVEIQPSIDDPPTYTDFGWHRILPRAHRPILETCPRTESIHPSVYEKMKTSGGAYPDPFLRKLLQEKEPQ